MTIAADTRIVSEQALNAFGAAVLIKVGVPESEAREIIDNLIQADLRDVESHGVVRLPIYVQRLAAKAINPRPEIRIVRETPTSAVVDGDNGMGQLVGLRAMQIAIDKAMECVPSFQCAIATITERRLPSPRWRVRTT
jgi:LDH2 family malate/lactate/ureidoglycolate dehydrogenase